MKEPKIIFSGPVGAGKTTAIRSLSEIPIVSTDEHARDMTIHRKPQTTVAMDYGLARLDGHPRVHLYGTPGQERFDFMWDILTEGGHGLVLLLDNTRANPFQDMGFFINAFRDFIDRNRLVVGVTRMDERADPGLEHYGRKLADLGLQAPVLGVDARSRRDVAKLVQTLIHSLDQGTGDNG